MGLWRLSAIGIVWREPESRVGESKNMIGLGCCVTELYHSLVQHEKMEIQHWKGPLISNRTKV